MRKIAQIACLSALFLVIGCKSSRRSPFYDWVMYNSSDQRIEKVEFVAGGDFNASDILFPGISAGWGPGQEPIPETAVLTWTVPGVGVRQQTVDVRNRIPDLKNFTGSIIFRYEGESWVVRPMSKEEEYQRGVKKLPHLPKD